MKTMNRCCGRGLKKTGDKKLGPRPKRPVVPINI